MLVPQFIYFLFLFYLFIYFFNSRVSHALVMFSKIATFYILLYIEYKKNGFH